MTGVSSKTGDQRLDAVFTDFAMARESPLALWQGQVVTCKKMDGPSGWEEDVAPLMDPVDAGRSRLVEDGKAGAWCRREDLKESVRWLRRDRSVGAGCDEFAAACVESGSVRRGWRRCR